MSSSTPYAERSQTCQMRISYIQYFVRQDSLICLDASHNSTWLMDEFGEWPVKQSRPKAPEHYWIIRTWYVRNSLFPDPCAALRLSVLSIHPEGTIIRFLVILFSHARYCFDRDVSLLCSVSMTSGMVTGKFIFWSFRTAVKEKCKLNAKIRMILIWRC